MKFLNVVLSQIIDFGHDLHCRYYYQVAGLLGDLLFALKCTYYKGKRTLIRKAWEALHTVEVAFAEKENVANKVMIHVECDGEDFLHIYDLRPMLARRAIVYAVGQLQRHVSLQQQLRADLPYMEQDASDFSLLSETPFFVEILRDDKVIAASTVKTAIQSKASTTVELNWGFAA